jgi:hypothetical protein|eukprot:scaffold1618_cov269-Chaetoceros_neogracile.AAC.4
MSAVFPGRDSIIPDMLSRDWHLSDKEIFQKFTCLLPILMHPNFKIKQVLCLFRYLTSIAAAPKEATVNTAQGKQLQS